MNIGRKLRELRLRSDLSQKELADRAGVSQGSISAIETGEQSPTLDMLEHICHALGLKVGELLADELIEPELPPHVRDIVEVVKGLDWRTSRHLAAFLKAMLLARGSQDGDGKGTEGRGESGFYTIIAAHREGRRGEELLPDTKEMIQRTTDKADKAVLEEQKKAHKIKRPKDGIPEGDTNNH